MGYAYQPGTPNYNASVNAGRESLTIGLDYYTVVTGVNILPTTGEVVYSDRVYNFQNVGTDVADITSTFASPAAYANSTEFVPGTIPNDFSQDALDRLIEIVSERGQPVILGTPVAVANGYSLKFAIEHPGAWGVTANTTAQTVPLLVTAIQTGGIDFGFNADANLAVMVCSSL